MLLERRGATGESGDTEEGTSPSNFHFFSHLPAANKTVPRGHFCLPVFPWCPQRTPGKVSLKKGCQS